MPIVIADIDVTIPDFIRDLASFRRWARSDDFPEKGRFAYLNGKLWMDPSMEAGFSHNAVKTEVSAVLSQIVKQEALGRYFSDGMLLSNAEAGLSTIPDGVFVSFERFRRREVRRVSSADQDFVELVGAPDMVLEVVSRSSEEKDTSELPELYYRAGIPEYWLIDARGERLRFDIYRRGPTAYTLPRRQAEGRVKSLVLGRTFRLTRSFDRAGDPTFTLEIR